MTHDFQFKQLHFHYFSSKEIYFDAVYRVDNNAILKVSGLSGPRLLGFGHLGQPYFVLFVFGTQAL